MRQFRAGGSQGAQATMRRWLVGAFLLMGVSFTALQALMVRELLVSLSGNELVIGFIFGAWLFLEAIGSALAGRLLPRIPSRPSSYAWLQVALAALLLPSLWAALRAPFLMGVVRGEAVAPFPALAASLLVLAPLGLVDGFIFTVACHVHQRGAGLLSQREGIYVLEALGSIAGGVAVTLLLFPHLSSTRLLLLLAALNLLSALSLFWVDLPRRMGGLVAAGLLGLLVAVVGATPLANTVQQTIAAGRWGAYELAYAVNSPYGHIAVTQAQEQITVWSNGTPTLTAPDPDRAAVEELVHLSALFLDSPPQRVLVVGGGIGGVIQELLRYPLDRVDYVELDPYLIQAVRAAPTTLTEAELSAPRLHLVLEDGRRFLSQRLAHCRQGDRSDLPCSYDLVLINLPPPTTLVLNRLYTEQFLGLARGLLGPQGRLALSAPPARTYAGPALRDLLVCYQRTLAAVFAQVEVLATDNLTLLVASDAPLALDAELLFHRWQEREMETQVLQDAYLRLLLHEIEQADLPQRLGQARGVQVNRDQLPAGLRYALAYEGAIHGSLLEPFYRGLGRLRWEALAVGLALLTVGAWIFLRRRSTVVHVAIVTSGTFGMGVDLLVLLAFQLLYGYLYQQVGLLVAAFMAGLALGGAAMIGFFPRLRRPWRAWLGLEALITVGALALAGLLGLLLPNARGLGGQGLLLLINFAGGAMVGAQFPLANRLLATPERNGARTAGFLYASDLVGATLGGVAVSAVLLPALGLVPSALLLAALKGGSLLLALRPRFREQGRGAERNG